VNRTTSRKRQALKKPIVSMNDLFDSIDPEQNSR